MNLRSRISLKGKFRDKTISESRFRDWERFLKISEGCEGLKVFRGLWEFWVSVFTERVLNELSSISSLPLLYTHFRNVGLPKGMPGKTFKMNWPWKYTPVTVILHVRALVNRIWYICLLFCSNKYHWLQFFCL